MATRYALSDIVYVFEKKSWQAAQNNCKGLGTGYDLVSIANVAEQNLVFSNSGFPRTSGNIWIGLNDFTVEDQWDWPDSCSSNPYTNWDPGEPNNFGTSENCVEMLSGNGKWNDYACSTLLSSVCVKVDPSCGPPNNPSPSLTASPTTTPMNPACLCSVKPDILVCPLVDLSSTTDSSLIMLNCVPFLYKILFVLVLHFLFKCHTIDLGKKNFLCFTPNVATLLLAALNTILVTLTFFARCWDFSLYLGFLFVFLHVDAVVCVADRILQRRPKAKLPVQKPTSNLEILALTNTKTSWRDKMYSTTELQKEKAFDKKNKTAKKKRKSLEDEEVSLILPLLC